MSDSIPSPIKSAFVIGYITFLGCIRNRLLLVTLVFTAVLVAVSVAAASVSLGARTRIITDTGLSAASAIGSLMAIALTISSFSHEIRNRTAYTIVVRPIPRWAYILGKYLGLALTMSTIISLMYFATAGIIIIQGESLPIAFWASIWLNIVEILLVTSIALFFSTMAVPVLAASYTGAVILAGNLSGDILLFARRAADQGHANTFIFEVFYYIVPDLQHLSLRTQAANNLPVPIDFVLHGSLYAFAYTAMAVIGAMWLFSKRHTI